MSDTAATSKQSSIDLKLVEGDGSIDRRLPHGGHVYMDRPLPFICVYRQPPERLDEVTERLVTTQASYIIASSDAAFHDEMTAILETISEAMIRRFGRFLILEVWGEPERGEAEGGEPFSLQPTFKVFAAKHDLLDETVTALTASLQLIKIHQLAADVHVTYNDRPAPPEYTPIGPNTHDESVLFVLGVEVSPIYRHAESGDVYPFLFDDLRRQLAVALKKTFFQFAATQSRFEAPNHLALGRRALEQAVSQVDEGLARIDASFDFLLLTTPVNSEEAWTMFEASDFEDDPILRYRPLPVDPELLKRRLFALPVEEVEDPALSWLFREKQEELDRKITMLRDRDTRQFFYGSLQLYGELDHDLLEMSRDILDGLPKKNYDLGSRENLDAEAFAEVASVEFNHYRKHWDAFPETVQIRHDMPAGLMVSRGHLLIGHQTRVPAPRVDPLLHHEVGTHMLTYYNGCAQPLHLLHNGLAGYEALQEGIAVLSEYLSGGLTVPRLRVLAARVVAAHGMVEGCTFAGLYGLLRSKYRFDEREAYSITLRTFRGGGLIKDVIYLRGLHELLQFLREGGGLSELFVGKIALHHLPLINELRDRGVLKSVPLRPRYLDDPQAQKRLASIQGERTIIDLIED